MKHPGVVAVLIFLSSTLARAGEVDVINARADCNNGTCRVSATLQHSDTGWDHYANHWRILAPDGAELGRRILAHPHEQEQPFTRSLGGVAVPATLDHVLIEGHDKVHGYGGKRFRLALK